MVRTISINRPTAGALLGALVWLAICPGLSANATPAPPTVTPVYLIDFSKGNIGGQPEIAPFVDDKTSACFEALNAGDDSHSQLFVANSLADLSGKSLELTDDGSGGNPWVGANLPYISSGRVRIAWKSAMLNVEAGKTRNLFTFWLFGSRSDDKNASFLIAMSYFTDGHTSFFGIQGISGQTLRGNWTMNKSDRIVMDIDLDAGSVSITANGVSLIDKTFGNDRITSLTGFRFGNAASIGGGDIKFSAAIGDVYVSSTDRGAE